MSSSRVARSEALLSSISKRTGVSEDGKQWLIAALDPFHDNPIHCNGFPDNRSDASVVQCVKQSLQISCPTTITTGTWDCHLSSYPWLEQSAFFLQNSLSTGNSASTFTSASTPTLNSLGNVPVNFGLSGIGIYQCPTGSNFGALSDTTHLYSNLTVPLNYLTGGVRVISTGFEVVNTTSPLNVQGLCTVWRSPISDFNTTNDLVYGSYTTAGTIATSGRISAWISPGPPANIGQAMLLADTKQWHAKEGAYVVPTLANLDIPIQYEIGMVPVLTNPLYLGSTQAGMLNPIGAISIFSNSSTTTGVPNGEIIFPAVNTYTNFNFGGAILTGLSLQTTLTLTWHVMIERFPANEATDLIVLATPSPYYDPQALELYACIAQHMPPGVMVKENGLGDWFATAVNFARNIVSPALAAIPHPVAQAGSLGLKGLIAANDLYKTSRQGNSDNMSVPRPMIKAAVAKKPAVRTNKALELRIAAAKKKMGK